jgi:hypothetical protein
MGLKTYTLNLGTRKTGLSDLRAAFVNTLGVTTSTVSTGFTELSNGQYLWTYNVSDSFTGTIRFYSNATPSDVFVSAAVNAATTAPPSENAETVNAYLYTRNSSGVITPSLTVSYQLIGVDDNYTGGSFSDDVQTVTSDSEGLAEITMALGAYYSYWVGSGRKNTVRITDETPDPYPLPTVTG